MKKILSFPLIDSDTGRYTDLSVIVVIEEEIFKDLHDCDFYSNAMDFYNDCASKAYRTINHELFDIYDEYYYDGPFYDLTSEAPYDWMMPRTEELLDMYKPILTEESFNRIFGYSK